MRIALTGNPNSGKTTMYNALTGRNEKVGNWAGVTVEKKEAPIKKAYCTGPQELMAVDLPGAYSMSPFTSEESVTSEYVRNEHPDVIVNIVDATNLSRSLFFTTQLMELGIPMVVALNKADVNEKKHTTIDTAALSAKLGCPVVETVSTTNEGLKNVIDAAVAQYGKAQKAPYTQGDIDLTSKEAVQKADRARFAFVNSIVKEVETRKVFTKDENFQDKIDEVITHPVLGIGIFAVVMFLLFYISQSTVGTWIADWLVGYIEMFQEWVAGLLEGANPLLSAILCDGIIGGVGAVVGFLPLVMVMYFLIALLEDCGYMARVSVVLDPIFKKVGLSGKSVIPFVIGTGCAIPGVMACRTIRNERERRATAMLTPFMPCGAKLPVIALFSGVFFADASWVGPLMYFVGIVLIFFGALLINKITGHKARKSFFIMELPEYKVPSFMRAFMSMLSRGWAYIVKAGTIILLCNFVVLLLQSFTWGFEFIDYAAIEESFAEKNAVVLEEAKAAADPTEYEAVMAELELEEDALVPLEELKELLPEETYAGFEAQLTAQSEELRAEMTAAADTSILKSIASPFAVLLLPLGFGVWQMAAAAITGFIAKENVVGTIAVCYGITDLISTGDLELIGSATEASGIIGLAPAAALACLVFNLFSPPCFAAIGAMNSEMKSSKWLWGGIAFQLGTGFTIGFAVYQIGTLITTGTVGAGFIPGLIAVAAFAAVIVYLIKKANKSLQKEYELKARA
ncbi:MAG: ferrous iron transporter B [Clostridia bacterium]|nr:ferrous iron transporter B [Clostridia bacterium]